MQSKVITRRRFLETTAIAMAAAGLSRFGFAAGNGLNVGAQSYSFRNFDLAGAIEQLKSIGLDTMEFCAVHFPPDATHPEFPEVKALLAESGIKVPCYGVEGFGANAAANRKKFEFAKALGVEVLTADVAPEGFDSVEALCEEFGIKIALHNHGPNARYDKVSDTLDAVKGRSALVGACLDTGHCIRSGENPAETAAALDDRLISLHLKDWVHGGKEQTLGEGDLDLVGFCKVLKAQGFNGPTVMEYENHPDNPAPHMKQGFDNWRAAWHEA